MLEDVLRQGFALAHHRFGLIFVDLLWKIVWFVATVVALLLVALWFGSQLQSIAWQDTGIRNVNAWIAVNLVREFWAAHKAGIYTAIAAVLLFSLFAWLVLQAFFHSRIVSTPNVKLFFVSSAAKIAILVAVAAILLPVALAGAGVVAAVIFVLIAFSLTLIDTLIRTNAVELLGTDLLRTTGLVGILFAFETMVSVSFAIALFAALLNASRLIDILVSLAAAIVIIVLLTLLHSYLLLVRFSAIDVMRKSAQ